jgi:hypothetical protein
VVVTPEQAAQLALLLAELGRSYATSTMVRT